ncbi:MAG: methionine--tRNA ligase subunit beta [Candidatus Paceibacterota bacterium]
MNDRINIDEFKRVDIRIGKILEVEVVPDADKLLKLTVDLGEEEPRTIVSGIREYFPDGEGLVGRKCPFVANLEPRKIRGLESNGMILAVASEGEFSLFEVGKQIPAGTRAS